MEISEKPGKSIQITEHFINLENVIASKNPKLLKLLPWFIKNYLKRIIHQEELNKSIYKNRNKFGIDFVNATLEDFGVNINVVGEKNISKTDRYVFASNHPLGGLDGMALISVVGKYRKDVIFPVNDFLMFLPGLESIFIPINKVGRNTHEAIKLFDKTFASDSTILYFPAGLCSRKKSGKIKDPEWKKTFITRARKNKRNIIPTYIDGRNSNFFYNLANLRKFLRIKTNIEMLYLVDEMYKQNNKTINIIFGKPISYTTFDKRFTDKQWAQKVKDYVYKLAKNNYLTFTTK